MLEKAPVCVRTRTGRPHKLHDIQGHGPPPVALGLFICEKDLMVRDFHDAAV